MSGLRVRWPRRTALRQAGFVAVLTVVFLVVNTSVTYAADTGTSGADLMSPLNITTSENVALTGYEVKASGGSVLDVAGQFKSLVIGGLFTLVQVMVGLSCWALQFALDFPLMKMLTKPAGRVSEVYTSAVVDTLGLKGLLLSWAFVFGLLMFMRGKASRGLGEIALTLVISALAASAFVRPDYLLAADGPLALSQQAGMEVAMDTVNSYDWGGTLGPAQGPCVFAGRAELKCLKAAGEAPVTAREVAVPIENAVTNALVVKPYMLLQYGRILDPGKLADRKAYAVHLKWVSGGYKPNDKRDDRCDKVAGPAKEYCREHDKRTVGGLPKLTPGDSLLDTVTPVISTQDQAFSAFTDDLAKAGPVGKQAAAYAKDATWWRASGAGLLLIAALLICAILLSASLILLGVQAACAGAAALSAVVLVWGMLPGPSRQVIWKLLSLFATSVVATFACCMFLPFFGIAVDAALTSGPDFVVEQLLLLDALALAGLFFHRRLLAGLSGMSRRMAMRMRFAKIGGTHLPGDSSEIGAALAMSGSLGSWAGHSGHGFAAVSGRGWLGTRRQLMGQVAALADGTGMPVDVGRVLSEAGAEASRGLAPLGIAAAAAHLGARGAWSLLVGQRPDEYRLAAQRGAVGDDTSGAGRPSGDVQMVSTRTGEIVDDPPPGGGGGAAGSGRALPAARVHSTLLRLRGYRILSRSARLAHGATIGLPRTARAAAQLGMEVRHQGRAFVAGTRRTVDDWQPVGRGPVAAARATATGIDRAGQHVFVAGQVHGAEAAGRARGAARDMGVAAGLGLGAAGRPHARSTQAAHSRMEDPATDARRRILDALMRAQRSTWEEEPRWGGERDANQGLRGRKGGERS